MASPASGTSIAIPESFSELEKFLVLKTEEAIHDGLQLEAWMRHPGDQRREIALNLHPIYRAPKLPNRPYGYFGSATLNGKPTSVMGARQENDFGKIPGNGDAAALLLDFVFGQFLQRAHWTYPDNWQGGFEIEQSLYRKTGGGYGKFENAECNDVVDWRRLGREFDWVLLTVRIHDFVMKFGPVWKHMKEAACVAPHAGFVHVVEKPKPGYELEVSVGYPFVEYAPIPNCYGFGPGKFGLACKTYTFLLTSERKVEVIMDFAAAPRCWRVFDFGKFPDPVYGGAKLLSRLTLGAYDPSGFHDKVDTAMVTQHCRVHQALMEGVATVWNKWVAGGTR